MGRIIGFLVLLFCAVVSAHAQESRIVQTAQGPVKGYKSEDWDIFHFYGIPYATAPNGTRRFTAPLPGPVWQEPFEAVKGSNIVCPQENLEMIEPIKSDMREDCLIANIYMPDTEKTNLPVMVYVHGGGYQLGYGESLIPNRLVQTKKVVAVTFNYRLGVHGFLCLGTEGAPGNAGMKDQVALLRWVQKNIANFGGNPDDVTIAGFSAGSSAVDLLMLSEMTKGLYNKVIPESGASVAAWSVQLDPVQNAKDYAKQLNFSNVDDISALEEFYSTVSFDVLTSDTFTDRLDSTFVFTPCVERDTGVEVFLDDAPVNILKQGKYRKVPLLYGFANMEGLLRIEFFEQWKDIMNERFSDFLPADLQFENDEEREQVADVVKRFYFGDKPVSGETIQGYIDYFSDTMFAYPHLRSLKLQVEAGSDSMYLYEYSFSLPFFPENASVPEYMLKIEGAEHCAQSFAVNDINFGENLIPETDEYKKMKDTMVELWLNFITTGKPVPEGSEFPSWPPVGANRGPHMELDSELKLKGPLLEEKFLFWDDIYERFYRTPVPPSQESRIVQTAQGPVKGYKSEDGDMFRFYGIPYATAPTGTKRFTAPLPGPVWQEPFEAVKGSNIVCPQGNLDMIDPKESDMREDCLIANIYMPDTEETNLPVMVYVHGGGYQLGYGESLIPNRLVQSKKVVAVTFNYRLGVLGFLCLGTEGAPGNAGMKDQVALLRWVQKNIASFGGNPDDVTIAGFSAGSSAVDLLMLSNMTKGLYNKVIPESGASVAIYSVQRDPVQNAKDYAKQLNFTNVDDIYALEEFYSTVSFDALISDTFTDRPDSYFGFSPCVERDTGVEIFLDDDPVSILKQGKYRKVPVLYGFANMEGLMRVEFFEQWKDMMNERFSDFLPADLQFENDEEREQVADIVKRFYFGDKPVSGETIQAFINYYSDTMFAYPHLRSVKLQVEAGSDSIYLYEYSFSLPYFPENANVPEYMLEIEGAGHCYQSFAVHDINFGDLIPETDEYKKMKDTMVELWLNFITTGKPVPEGSEHPLWPPVGANRGPYMDLNSELKLKGLLLEERFLFWDDIYERFHRAPVPPSQAAQSAGIKARVTLLIQLLSIFLVVY